MDKLGEPKTRPHDATACQMLTYRVREGRFSAHPRIGFSTNPDVAVLSRNFIKTMRSKGSVRARASSNCARWRRFRRSRSGRLIPLFVYARNPRSRGRAH